MIDTEIIQINPAEIRLLKINARYMRHETFQRLVDNIAEDGGLLGNAPFCWHVHDDITLQPIYDKAGNPIWEVLSGNHRTKAAVAAGIEEIDIAVTRQYIPPDKRKAIQLSQNSITGEDDPAILKTIYESISDVTMRVYSGMDDKTLELMSQVSIVSLSEANLDFQTISLTFLPEEVSELELAFKEAKQVAASSKAYWLTSMREYDAAMDAMEAAAQSAGIMNVATAMLLVTRVFMNHLDDLSAQYLDEIGEPVDPNRSVPISTLLGLEMKASTAARLRKRIQQETSRGNITRPEEIIDFWLNTEDAEQNGD